VGYPSYKTIKTLYKQTVQKKVIRISTDTNYTAHTRPIFLSLSIPIPEYHQIQTTHLYAFNLLYRVGQSIMDSFLSAPAAQLGVRE
jgi:hypothetical protein